jgi:hypothetical protein
MVRRRNIFKGFRELPDVLHGSPNEEKCNVSFAVYSARSFMKLLKIPFFQIDQFFSVTNNMHP